MRRRYLGGDAPMLRHRAHLRFAAMPRAALGALWIAVTLATLSVGFAGAAGAQVCPPGTGLCNDGLCYPLGSQCCSPATGGGACNQGSNCWAGNNTGNFCCPVGSVGYRDGGCAPIGISDYCGSGRFCTRGACCNSGMSCCF